MSDYDRGPYTPPTDRLSFDPREPVRSGGPAPVTLIVSGLILVAIIGGAVLLYKGGFRHKGDAPTTVGAPVTDMKTPDANAAAGPPPSQLTIDKTNTVLAPAAPAAAPAAPPLAAVPGPPPAAVAPAPTPAPAQTSLAPARPAPTMTAAAAPPAAAIAHPAPVAPAKPPRPLTIASLADDAVHHPTPLRPAIAPPAAPAAAAAPTGHWAQIGAFSSAALADKGWTEIAGFDRADMAGKHKDVQATTHNGATFYRTIVTGFSSQASAEAFCAKLKAAKKPCIAK
jgi:hypothetical protein